MKKGLLKAGVLLLLFAAALGGTAALINREKIVGTRGQSSDSVYGSCGYKGESDVWIFQ